MAVSTMNFASHVCGLCGVQTVRNKYLRRYSSFGATKMKAWQIHQYGGIEELTLHNAAKAATIKSPKEILVKVDATSVNPIDIRMMGGYGRKLINVMRGRSGVMDDVMRGQRAVMDAGTEFPLVLGRDFAGTVVETGRGVRKFRVGDQVWGALSAERSGAHAEFTVVSQAEISHKPANLPALEASSLPYVACTTWAALCTVGGLRENQAQGKRILILGGSGGIGHFAIQLCKAWGMHVTVTCLSDAFHQVKSLGADAAVDYSDVAVWRQLGHLGKYDVILDTVGGNTTDPATKLLSPWANSKLVSLNFPLLHNSDNLGILPGLMKSALRAGIDTVKGLQSGGSVRWAVFLPNGGALDKVRRMVEAGQIKPQIQQVFPFSELPQAYQCVKDGHLRGKVVIDT